YFTQIASRCRNIERIGEPPPTPLLRQSSRGNDARSRTTRRAYEAWRGGANERELPRPPWSAVSGILSARSALCFPHPPEEPGLHCRGSAHTRHWNRRKYCHLQRRLCRAAFPSALSKSRTARHGVVR